MKERGCNSKERKQIKMIQEFILEGKKIINEKSFYKEIQKELLVDSSGIANWDLDVFSDVLDGGYGLYDLDKEIKVIWRNIKISRKRVDSGFLNSVIEIIKDHSNIDFIEK